MNSMEGRWGRRISGSVTRHRLTTTFLLSYKTRENQCIRVMFREGNETLEQYPDQYGHILNMLVARIEEQLNHTQGDHPC